MNNRIIGVILLLCLMLLASCNKVSTPEDHPVTETPAVSPSVTPAPKPVPTPFPEPETEVGGKAICNGIPLPSGFVLKDGLQYVKLSELSQVLGFSVEHETGSTKFSFPWRKSQVVLCAGESDLRYRDCSVPMRDPALLCDGGEGLLLPVDSFCNGTEIGVLFDEESNCLYITPAAGNWPIPKGYNVPVMMYHGVGWGDETANLFVNPWDLEAQIVWLLESGYTPIWFEDLEHVEDYEKPIILTFDDGWANNYENLLPLVKQYKIKVTIFPVYKYLKNSGNHLSVEQALEMADTGYVSFQSHTMSHIDLTELSEEDVRWELENSRLELTRLFGIEPCALSYPIGGSNEKIQNMASQYYRFAVKMCHYPDIVYNTSDDPMVIWRFFPEKQTLLEVYQRWCESAFPPDVHEEAAESEEPAVMTEEEAAGPEEPVITAEAEKKAAEEEKARPTSQPDDAEPNPTWDLQADDIIYFGVYKDVPVAWQVLDPTQTNTGERGVFLLSRDLIDSTEVVFDESSTLWEGSLGQQWCTEFASAAFSQEENTLIPHVSKHEDATRLFALDWREVDLREEQVFFLSAIELEHYFGGYGPEDKNTVKDCSLESYWWLRSPHRYHDDYHGIVLQSNMIHDYLPYARWAARPCMNLCLQNALYLLPAEDEGMPGEVSSPEQKEVREWKLLIVREDGFHAETAATDSEKVVVDYTGAEFEKNTMLSLLCCDKNGNPLSLRRLARPTAENGTVTIDRTEFNLPDGAEIYLLCEQISDPYLTNYAGKPQKLAIDQPKEEAVAPEDIPEEGAEQQENEMPVEEEKVVKHVFYDMLRNAKEGQTWLLLVGLAVLVVFWIISLCFAIRKQSIALGLVLVLALILAILGILSIDGYFPLIALVWK